MKKLTDQDIDDLQDVLESLTISEACLVSPDLGNNLAKAKVQVRAAKYTLDNVLKRIQE
jgi:hypothetical protein